MKIQNKAVSYFRETEKMVNEAKSEEDAVNILRRIMRLYNCPEEFINKSQLAEWEEFALSFIESPQVAFDNIIYPERRDSHFEMKIVLETFEAEVLGGTKTDIEYFNYLESVNREIREFNGYCRIYDRDFLDEFVVQNEKIKEEYEKWKLNINEDDLNYIRSSQCRTEIVGMLYYAMDTIQGLADLVEKDYEDIEPICEDLTNRQFISYSMHNNTKLYRIEPKGIKIIRKIGVLDISKNTCKLRDLDELINNERPRDIEEDCRYLIIIGDYERGLIELEKLKEVDPDYEKYYYFFKAECLNGLDRTDEALNFIDKAIEISPNESNRYSLKGDCLEKLGRYVEALEYHNKAIELSQNSQWLGGKVRCLEKLGRTKEAEEYKKLL